MRLFGTIGTYLLIGFMLSVVIVAGQSDECPLIAQDILTTVAEVCEDTGRNQVCYGNIAITAEGRNDAFRLEAVGDIANLIDMQRLTLSPYDEDAGLWGIALMRLQANLPDTLPGQNVTMLAFGDVSLTNAVNLPVEVTATLTANGRARRTPTTAAGDLNVLTVISSGTSVEVLGRNERGDWLLIRLPEIVNTLMGEQFEFGWISTQVLRTSGDVAGLNTFSNDVLEYKFELPSRTPMSTFYLKTGIGPTNCAEMPPDGVLVQTPRGVGHVELTVNNVTMNLGSTVFLKTVNNLFVVIVVDGTAIISANGVTQFIPAGAESFIAMNDDFTAPVDVPSAPQPYKAQDVLYLPITDTFQLLPEAVGIIEPLDAENIEETVQQIFAPYGGVDGVYEFRLSRNITHYSTVDNPGIQFGSRPYRRSLRFTEIGIFDKADVNQENPLLRIAPDTWGDTEEKHRLLSVLGPKGSSDGATTIRAIGLGVLEAKFTLMFNRENGIGSSTGIYIGTWVAPLDD